MKEVIQNLNTVPGIVGSMVIGEDGAILTAAFPSIYDDHLLTQVASLLSDEATAVQGLRTEGTLLEFRYAKGRVFARPFKQGLLAVVGTNAINAQLLDMSLNLAVRKLERGVAMEAPPPSVAKTEAKIEAKPQPIAAPMADLPQIRARLQQALIRQIGPVGRIILDRACLRMLDPSPTRESLQQLVLSLANEIDDPGAREEFNKETRGILNPSAR